MREQKRKRLEERGWKVGNAAEFLNLSEEESTYIDLKLSLAYNLKQHRLQRKLSQLDAAGLVGSSQSRFAKMESGDPSVSIDLLVKTLLALGASRKELAQAIEHTESAPVT